MAFAHTGIGWPVAVGFFLIAAAAIFGLWGPQLLQDILATDVKGIGATFGLYFLLGTVAMLALGSLAVMGPIKQELGLAAALAVPGVCLALSAVFALMISRRLSKR